MGIGVSLRGEECDSSGHDQVLLLLRIQTTFPGSTSATSYFSVKGNYASSTRRALACFFLPNNKPLGWAVCHTEETMKTSAVTIRKATKFIAMWRPLHFNTKIHTCAPNIFFCWERYVAEQVRKKLSWKWEPYLSRLGLIPAKEKQTRWILKMPPYRRYTVTMEILSFPFLFARKFPSMRTRFAAVSVPPDLKSGNKFGAFWFIIW